MIERRNISTRPSLEKSLSYKVNSAINKSGLDALSHDILELEINAAVREFNNTINFLRKGKDP
jgi:hypothetical protein